VTGGATEAYQMQPISAGSNARQNGPATPSRAAEPPFSPFPGRSPETSRSSPRRLESKLRSQLYTPRGPAPEERIADANVSRSRQLVRPLAHPVCPDPLLACIRDKRRQ
jgi:hypothetical protein